MAKPLPFPTCVLLSTVLVSAAVGPACAEDVRVPSVDAPLVHAPWVRVLDPADNEGQDDEVQPSPALPPPPLPPGYGGGVGTVFGRQGPNSMQFPPTVIGPGGVVKTYPQSGEATRPPPPPKPLTAEERAARIRRALAPKPPRSIVRRHTLDDLYTKLAVAKDEDEAKGLAAIIGGIWLRSGSDTADLLMQRALDAVQKKDYPVALDLLDHLIALKPSWAEAWNKRASVRFYAGNMDGAMADVEHVLKLEPRHFGALDGMGMILQRTGFDKRALEVFRRSLAIYPMQPDVAKAVEKLQLDVEGQGI